MAEATASTALPPCNARFFCHQCRSEVRPNMPAYTCSRCNSGFIEEMESRPALPSQSHASSASSLPDPAAQFAEMFNNSLLDRLHPGGVPGMPGILWGAPRHSHRYNTRQAARHTDDMDESEEDELRGVAPSTVFHFNSGDHQPNQTFHGIINYVIQRLGSDLGAGGGLVQLHGNPGDYAWGTGGLDAIISQLFNQLEGSGAPPAQKEKIESLPTITIDQSHIDATLQCSICMDDFELNQKVRKLPCDHMYHSDCIVRWLEMHGTCPVCRKDLNGEDTSTNELDYNSVFPPGGSGSSDDGQGASSSSSSSSSISMGPSGSSSYSMDDHSA